MIETPRLILRRWREAERAPFAAMNANPRVMEFMIAPLSRVESDALVDRIEAHFDQHGYGLWAIERRDLGAFIGFVGLCVVPFETHFTPAIEIGWRIAADHWGHGFATEAAIAARDYAFGPLGLSEIVSFTAPINVRSRRVMEKIGMTRESADDFDHPRVPEGHPLRRHVLYRLSSA